MKILHVITTLDVGGAEVHLLAQVAGQTRRGHAVRVAYMKGEGRLATEFRSAGAEWIGCVGSGPLAALRLARAIGWSDVVHSHLLKADALAAIVATARGRRRTLVSSKHNDEQALRHPLVSRVHGVVGNLPVRTIALSDHVARFVEEHGRVRRDRLRRVYYGIDPARFELAALDARARAEARAQLAIAPGEIVFTCVARFAPQKAHDVLLRAFAEVLERSAPDGPACRLLLVGDDPFGDGRARAETLARELGLGDRAIFAGIRRDVPELLAASDVFVMSSLWEGFGLVFLEAMSAGLSVIATRVSGVPEVVEDGTTGWLVAAGDPRAFADRMLAAARDPGTRAQMGARGRARVRERFLVDRMVEETLAVYREILAGTG